MTADEIPEQLREIEEEADFAVRSRDLVRSWDGLGVEAVEPVLRFIEEHPDVDFGAPGPLVHFVERFHKRGYEQKLVESVERKPTPLNVWMLNRLLNGTEDEAARQRLIDVMTGVQTNPRAEPGAVEDSIEFLAD